MRMYNFFRKILMCILIAGICPSFAFSAETCPSGYVSVASDATLSDDAIIVTDGDTCPSGYTSVVGDIKDVVNCISDNTVDAPVCTFYDETYTVEYDCNGGTGSATGSATYNSVFTPRTDVCTRDGYSFNGYTIDGNTVSDKFTWTYPGARVLVAQWEKVGCTDNKMLVNGTCVEPEFTITTTEMSAGATFSFKMSASGVFYVDFDDGRGVQKIDRTNNTSNTTYTSATYADAGTHIIKMYGDATGYSTSYGVAAISFKDNTNIKTVDGSLGAIFSGKSMFYSTFSGCTSLQSIPADLFSGVTGSASDMFTSTFYGCTSLESIPAGLFSGVTGSSEYMFSDTFSGCTSLESIPAGLFSGVTGSSQSMFRHTFSGCTSLQSIPADLFSGVTGSASDMFTSTFYGCTSLESIPAGLFSGVTGSSEYMFTSTFRDCTSLQSIPADLFSGVTGSANAMFQSTFNGCTSLESIPADLFSGVTGSSEYMFNYTFENCTSLASLPDGLFKNIEGKPATDMFYGTFSGCTNLSGYIPADTFAKMDSTDFDSATMESIFAYTALDTSCPAGTTQYITGFESAWNGKVACETISCTDDEMLANGECVEPEVVITTTEMQPMDTFIFYINSDGEFYVDWGDGNAEHITSRGQVAHTYSEAGVYNIGLYGQATGYNFTSSTDYSIGFMGNKFVKKVTGSFGDIFGVLPDGTNPSFSFTFTNCTNLEEVSEDLFSGLTGGRERMFFQTFTVTPSLKEIPAGLFSSITTGAPSMFEVAFASSGLTSLPDGLFANIQGKPATNMFTSTFAACENLTGYIPADMFASLSSEDFDASTMNYIFGGTNLGTTCPDGTVQYITGFESAWEGKVACAPCPDGVCSKTVQCSDENGFGERTCYFDANTGDYTNCDETCTYTLCNDKHMMVDGTCVEPEFTITTTEMSAGAKFSFKMSASGVFYVDFDDGRGVQKIDKTNNTSDITYTSAAYSTAGTHTIKMYGDATGYTTSSKVAAVSFQDNTNIKTVDGSLGAIFGGNTPYMFYRTFRNCTSLESIPADLFSGIKGSSKYMFYGTFYNCTSLQSIHADLFSGVTGSSDWLFGNTFYGCTSLESIPAGLFSGVKGSSESMFNSTFEGCTSLQSIPAGLFSGVTGSGKSMFNYTFSGCTSLESIPADLFSGVTGSAYSMFEHTFSGCTSLKSIPADLFSGVTESASWLFGSTFSGCTSLESIPADLFSGVMESASGLFSGTFSGCTSLKSIPADLFSGVTGSAYNMFFSTFSGCTSLQSIPSGLFSGVTGSSDGMFGNTFKGCTSLQSIPADLFSGVTGSSNLLFYYTFSGCTSLASLPDGLFKNIEGKPADNMFSYTFSNCTNLSGYIPADTFAKMDSTDFKSSRMGSIFAGTALDTSCPAGTTQYITGFESAWSGKVACTPCPDGVCSKTVPCSDDNGFGERTCYFDANTGDYTNCDETCTYTLCNGGYYMNGISCTPCPGALTSAIGATSIDECGAVRTLHIGENDTMQLFSIRPSSSPMLVVEIDGNKYFGQMSMDSSKTISSESDKQFRILYDNKDYYLHDFTVQ